MAKSKRYTPPQLKNFIKIFDSLAIKHNSHRVFDDFLDLFINGFCFNYKIDLENIRSRYSQKERYTFGRLIQETILILNKELKVDDTFYDVFGTFYELQSLTNKYFAQFFTPTTVCTFMAQILEPQQKEFISDPCCGSGRLSLAANSVNIGAFHTLIDKDYTCAKMSALNLMLHGIDGIVICDNGLLPGRDFNGAFIVNRFLGKERIPRIEFVNDVNRAYNYVRARLGVEEKLGPKKNETKIEHNDIKDLIVNPKTNQISMF